jgi:hypothetical protein
MNLGVAAPWYPELLASKLPLRCSEGTGAVAAAFGADKSGRDGGIRTLKVLTGGVMARCVYQFHHVPKDELRERV